MATRDDEEQSRGLLSPTPEYLASVKVFPLIPNLKRDVITYIDTALTWDQLTAADINFTIVRPLVQKYAKLQNMAMVYACFVVRSHFLSEAEENLAFSALMNSRASLCEIIAIKLLGRFASNQLQLASVLTASWSPLAGAPADVINEVKQNVGPDAEKQDPQCALEMAIATEAKNFLSSPLVQTVVNDIYSGRVVFSSASQNSVLVDNYKPRATEVYDVHTAPFLDHYRLRVPKYGAILEFLNFAVLLALFVLCLQNKNLEKTTPFELLFIVFAIAFALEEYTASKERGWGMYIANIWNAFDTAFVVIVLAFIGLRVRGVVYNDLWASDLAFDILSCGACILFPRLAFFAVSNNVIVIALRAMALDFFFFIGVAAICFSGLLYTLHTLAWERWSVKSIAWLMVQIWFGNTYLSFAQASSFHPVFGPILMTCFAALSSTLLLTILISILSNTFARIDANASKEYLFQYAISTIEGSKSDALFSYQPPFNLFAFLILWPLSFILSPRALHTVNVFLIRLTSFPVLVVIAVYERHLAEGRRLREAGEGAAHNFFNSFSKKARYVPFLERLVGSSSMDLYDAIFDVDPANEQDIDIFTSDDEADRPGLRSRVSRESMARSASGSRPPASRRPPSLSRVPQSPVGKGRSDGTPNPSPRMKRAALPTLMEPTTPTETAGIVPRSPLTRLYTGRRDFMGASDLLTPGGPANSDLKRLEGLVDDIRHLPVNKLKEEMKELQDRQARIENLLLMLTRGMRNETGTHSSIRHDTV